MGTHNSRSAGGSCGCGNGACSTNAQQAQPRVSNRCCGGRDLGPLQDDEGPLAQDIERFGDVTQTCPSCKAELYDDAEICYQCGHHFSAGAARKGTNVPAWAMVTAVLLLLVAIVAIVR